MRTARLLIAGAALLTLGLLGIPVHAAQYDTGANDKEIKLGGTHPFSGAASAYGAFGKAVSGYFKSINDAGGVNGRKIVYVDLDDGYSPPKTVEQIRRLVEQEEVLAIFNSLGTPSNSAIRQYLNDKKVPHIFVATGATKWGDYEHYHWTIGWQPNYQTEGKIYARYILDNIPNAKIGILFQNDDYGKDYVAGMKIGLGSKTNLIVAEQSYEVSDPTVDSQMVNLKNSGANVFFNVTTPKFAAQAIKAAAGIGWKPVHFLNNVSNSIGAVLTPAGLEASQGLISASYYKDPDDPHWNNDSGMKAWRAWMAKYQPDASIHDNFYVIGYLQAQTMVQALKQCGDNLTRENLLKQAANLHNLELDMLLPGIKVNTSPTDYSPIEQEQLERFDGKRWVLFGKVING